MECAIPLGMECLCKHCCQLKPIENFYPYSKSKCKECWQKYNDKWRLENPDKAKAIDKRKWLNRRDKMLARYRATPRRSNARDCKEVNREYRRNHRIEWNAKARVRYAVLTGKLIRPNECSECGYICTPQAHHEDYSKPLDVIWLCASCHKRLHVERRITLLTSEHP